MDRISALYIKKFESPSLFGCALVDVPLGGENGYAPAAVVAMSNTNPAFQSPFLGIAIFGGAALTHEVAHVMGLQHTAETDKGVVSYNKCGLDLRYPQFSRADLDDSRVEGAGNVTYNSLDWKGRTNMMAQSITLESHGRQPHEIGLFVNGYSSVFEDIIQCWFNRANVSAQ